MTVDAPTLPLPEEPQATPLAGLTLGRYEVGPQLGRGGMGVVYLARDPQLDREVALKVLDEAWAERDQLERLQREASCAAQLSHPGIVAIHEIGAATPPELGRTVHYIAMARIRGRSLAEAAAELSRIERVEMIGQVALAVAHAHDHGVVHRDLKPANILIREGDGRPVVIDFGLARDAAAAVDRLTRTGAVMGTPHYMAPEQVLARRDEIGPQTDVWALGVLMFELLAHQLPFDGATPAETLQAILAARPSEARLRSLGPLAGVCRKALARSPAERYPDAGALAEDLRRARAGLPTTAASGSTLSRVRRRLALHRGAQLGIASLLLALGVVVVVALQSWRRTTRRATLEQRARRAVEAREWDAAEQAARQGLRLGPAPALEALLARIAAGRDADQQAAARALAVADAARALATRAQPIEAELAALIALTYRADADLAPRLPAFDASLRALDDAARAAPAGADAAPLWVLLGRGWQLLGRHGEAERALERALTIAPDDPAARLAAARLGMRRALRGLTLGWGAARVSVLARKAARHLALARGTAWSGARPIDRAVMAGYRALAAGNRPALARVCREALARFEGLQGAEELHMLSSWLSADLAGKRREVEAALAIRPHDATLRLLMAGILRLQEHPGPALVEVERAIALQPYASWGYNLRGGLRAGRGERTEALADFERGLALAPDNPMLLNNRATILTQLGRHREALADFERVVALAPGAAEAYNHRGAARRHTGDLAGALADYDRALALDPELVEGYYNRALALTAAGRPRDAVRDLDRTLALAPAHRKARIARARQRLEDGDATGAEADYRAGIARWPNDRALVVGLAEALLQQERFDDARVAFERVLQDAPDHVASQVGRGVALRRLGRRAEALACAEQALASAPRNVDALVLRASLREAAGQRRAALADYDRALRIDPRHAEAYGNRGNVHTALGRHEAALKDYERALALAPSSAWVLVNRGGLLSQLGRLEAATADLDRAVTLAPRLGEAYVNRGNHRMRLQQTEGAMADYFKAVELAPRFWQAGCNLAIMLHQQRRYDDAIDVLRRIRPLASDRIRRTRVDPLMARLERDRDRR